MLEAYFASLRANYNLQKQITVINKLEKYNLALVAGVESSTSLGEARTELVTSRIQSTVAINKAKMELLDSQKELLLAKKDSGNIDAELELRDLEIELEKLEIQEKIVGL